MTKRVLIIGGYGNFGRYIAKSLARDSYIRLIISGRNDHSAKELAETLDSPNRPEYAYLDINRDLKQSLAGISPDIVIHTSGPFQGQGYKVAEACIEQGCHYIDLADARDFVSGISILDQKAKNQNVLVCAGASSVPCLTGAIVDEYLNEFDRLETLEYAIATAQLTNRGLATTSAVLSYAGKPFRTLIDGTMQNIYGWLGLRFRDFWKLNRRALGNCDIPDLEIFPKRYPDLQTIRFQAGLELRFLHIVLWALSGLARFRLFPPLQPLAPLLLRIALLFDPFGRDNTGFYMTLVGTGKNGGKKEIKFDLIARHGDGLYIPCMPSILIARKLACGELAASGASPCVGYITLDDYLSGLQELDIEWRVTGL